jgi:tetratricopeptide (TPR) repeat protein
MQGSSRAPIRSRSHSWLHVLWPVLIAIAVGATFLNGISTPFLLDDEISILENESLRKLVPISSALWPRAEVYTAGRPLLNLSFALNYAWSGTAVRGYHVTNILIHAAAAAVLFGIVRRTLRLPRFRARFAGREFVVAAAAALGWALHPLQTASVTYISQRAESLMGLCYLSTLYGLIRTAERPGSRWAIFTVVVCAAGMLVKEIIVTAPLVLLLFDRTLLAGSFKETWRLRRRLYVGLAATWLLLFACMFASRIHERGVGYGFTFAWHEYFRIECSAILHYLRLALFPVGLVFDYGQEIAVPPPARVAVAMLLLGLMAGATVIALRRRSSLGFLGCWWFIILAPTSSFLPVAGQPIAENRVYLPLAAVSVGIAAGAFCLLRARAVAALVAMVVALGWLTVTRNRDYRSNLAIWSDTVAKRPGSARAWCYYGNALLHLGKVDEAIPRLESALRIRPTYAQAHINLGNALLGKSRLEDAIRHFETGVRLKPDEPLAHSNLGTALFQSGRKAEALGHYQQALRLRPNFVDAQINLGIVLGHLGRTAEALAAFEAAVRDHPENESARENLRLFKAAFQPPGR